jgi:hypothetical protein
MSKRSTWEEDEEAWGMTFSLVSGEEEVKEIVEKLVADVLR